MERGEPAIAAGETAYPDPEGDEKGAARTHADPAGELECGISRKREPQRAPGESDPVGCLDPRNEPRGRHQVRPEQRREVNERATDLRTARGGDRARESRVEV